MQQIYTKIFVFVCSLCTINFPVCYFKGIFNRPALLKMTIFHIAKKGNAASFFRRRRDFQAGRGGIPGGAPGRPRAAPPPWRRTGKAARASTGSARQTERGGSAGRSRLPACKWFSFPRLRRAGRSARRNPAGSSARGGPPRSAQRPRCPPPRRPCPARGRRKSRLRRSCGAGKTRRG